jgi:hypothetical protein
MQTSNYLTRLWEYPFHPWLVAASSVVLLLAHNILEVNVEWAVRPLLVSLIAATIIYLVLAAFLQNRHRAALLATLLIVLFMSYGHLYQFLKETPILGLTIGRHRYLVPVYGTVLVAGLWFAVRGHATESSLTLIVNLVALAILLVPVYEIGSHALSASRARRAVEAASSGNGEAFKITPGDFPDVYYIILDGYTRGDALKRDLGYDNSSFLESLEAMGFYVAECSRSNYAYTQPSLTSSLNGEYVTNLQDRLDELGMPSYSILFLLSRSLIREELENLGYQTVAFQTDFGWSDIRDADIYLSLHDRPLSLQTITPFEALYAETTAIKVLLDTEYILTIAGFGAQNLPYRTRVEMPMYIFQELPKIASIRRPTFTFAHILIPHFPYVFSSDGEFVTDPAILEDHSSHVGYTGQVAFVSSQMLGIAQELIDNSEIPPIIIIQGDHGLEEDNRLQILNAYYLPGNGADDLYPTISPVNTFRIILNRYFGADYDLLPDYSYSGREFHSRVPETAPECISVAQ